MKRSHLIAAVALAAIVLVASVVSVAVFSRRVQVLAGTRVECVYGHVVKEDVKAVKVRPSEASQYGVKTSTTVCADHRKAEKLYNEAQEALKKGDTKTAKEKLAEIVILDRGFKRASSQLTDLDGGKTPQAASDTGAATPGTGSKTKDPASPSKEPSNPVGPIASLASWMPGDIQGFDADRAIADALSISREYRATSGGDVLVISAEQIGSISATKEALQSRVRMTYDRDGRTVKVGGRSGWLGTDGHSVAVLGLTDGPVLVIFQVRTSEDPAKRTEALLEIAKGLPR